jgi:hypothetical protein
MFEEGITSPTDASHLTKFLYSSTVAMQIGSDHVPYSMLYAGMEDGLFTGYFSPTSYTLRAPSGKPEDVPWAPYILEASCGDGNDASGATCEVSDAGNDCAFTTGACSFVAGVNEVCAASEACRGVAGKTVQPSGTCPGDDAMCVDADLRNYYRRSVDASITFTRWRQYDPRVRGWYISGKALWENNQQKLAYSAVYEFSTSGELGITATGAFIQNSVFLGLFAIDYDLVDISTLLKRVATGDNEWAYAIERSGPSAGVFVGSTVDDDLGSNLRVQPGERLYAKNSVYSPVRESTYLLEPNSWPEGHYQRFDSFNVAAKYHKCYLKLGFGSCAVPVEDQFTPWAPADPSERSAAGPANCGDVSTPCIKANVDFGGNVEGCGYAPMIGIAVDSTSWIAPGWFTGDVSVHPNLSSPEDCQALCRDFVDDNGNACEYFSYEWESFTAFEIITSIFTGAHNQLDWYVHAIHDGIINLTLLTVAG